MRVKKTIIKRNWIIFSALLLFAISHINPYLVQTFSFCIIVIFAIISYCKNIKIMTLIFSLASLCLLLFQYLIVLGDYDISTFAIILIICYYLVYLALFLELLTISDGSNNLDASAGEKLFFRLVISFFLVAFLLGNFESQRFSGPFENVLNFTGVISVIFSFYLIAFGVSVRSILISVFVLIFSILSMSKILVLLWVLFVVLVILKDTRHIIISCVCVLALLVFYSDWINLHLESIFKNLSIAKGPIMHRLDRYSNISYFNMTGIPHAQTTVCSYLMDKTCLTSESFIMGFILTYGISGIPAIFLYLYNIRNVRFTFIFVFTLLTGGLNTPYTILVLWSFIKIYQSFVCNIGARLDPAIKGMK